MVELNSISTKTNLPPGVARSHRLASVVVCVKTNFTNFTKNKMLVKKCRPNIFFLIKKLFHLIQFHRFFAPS